MAGADERKQGLETCHRPMLQHLQCCLQLVFLLTKFVKIYFVKGTGFSFCFERILSSVVCQTEDLFTLVLHLKFIVTNFNSIIWNHSMVELKTEISTDDI